MGVRIAGYIAVGDVHGSLEALDQVIRACGEYSDHRFVFLGDYVDGGPESDGVVSRLRSLDGVFLIGNHEVSLIRASTGAPGKVVPDYIFVHAGLDPRPGAGVEAGHYQLPRRGEERHRVSPR